MYHSNPPNWLHTQQYPANRDARSTWYSLKLGLRLVTWQHSWRAASTGRAQWKLTATQNILWVIIMDSLEVLFADDGVEIAQCLSKGTPRLKRGKSIVVFVSRPASLLYEYMIALPFSVRTWVQVQNDSVKLSPTNNQKYTSTNGCNFKMTLWLYHRLTIKILVSAHQHKTKMTFLNSHWPTVINKFSAFTFVHRDFLLL